MAKVLEINPDVLQFYVDHAEISFEVLQSKCPHFMMKNNIKDGYENWFESQFD